MFINKNLNQELWKMNIFPLSTLDEMLKLRLGGSDIKKAVDDELTRLYGEHPPFFTCLKSPSGESLTLWGKLSYVNGKTEKPSSFFQNIPIHNIETTYSESGSTVFYLDKNGGTVYICGLDNFNLANQGFSAWLTKPELVSFTRTTKILQVVADHGSIFFVTTLGKVLVLGNNDNGRLGLGNDNNVVALTEISLLDTIVIRKVISTAYSTFFVTNQCKVYVCGRNVKSHMGLEIQNTPVPTEISFADGAKISKVISSGETTFFLTDEAKGGFVYACGNNKSGQLGLDGQGRMTNPSKILSIDQVNICQVIASKSSTFFITNRNSVLVCGENSQGELGSGNREVVGTPMELELGENIKTVKVDPDGETTFFITVDERVLACGDNTQGQLFGSIDLLPITIPRFVSLPGNAKIIDIRPHKQATTFITDKGIIVYGNKRTEDQFPAQFVDKSLLFHPVNFEINNFNLQYQRFMQRLPICWWKPDGNVFKLQPTNDSNYQPVNFDASFFYAAVAKLDPVAFAALLSSIEQRGLLPQAQRFLAEATDGRYISRAATYQSVNNFRWILNYSPKHMSFSEDCLSNIINSESTPKVSAFLDFLESNTAGQNLLSNVLKKNPGLLDHAKSKLSASIYHRLLLLNMR